MVSEANKHEKRKAFLPSSLVFRLSSFDRSQSERGSNLMETLLAIGLVALMTPFVYNRVLETSNQIKDISIARQIVGWNTKMTAYIRKNQADWPTQAEVDLDQNEFYLIQNGTAARRPTPAAPARVAAPTTARLPVFPYAAFITKYAHRGGTAIDAYVAFPAGAFTALRMNNLVKTLGVDAAIVGDDSTAYSVAGGWSIASKSFRAGDLVYRVSVSLPINDAVLFLHRMKLDDDKLNTMERDLIMGGHSIKDVDDVAGGLLDSKQAGAFFATADTLTADSVVFANGATIDPTNTTIKTMRVTGDIVGFRTVDAGTFTGTGVTSGWPAQGTVIADRATITGSVQIGRNLTLRTSDSATVSGFTGVSAYSVNVPYISTTELRFADGFGITISNELSGTDSASGPLKLGSWIFPSARLPNFTTLNLKKSIGDVAAAANVNTAEFNEILGPGWKALRTKTAAQAPQ